MEISPNGPCNHKCIFCAFEYLEYQKRFIDRDVMLRTLKELGECGVKSAMFAGEGEPLIHPNISEFVQAGKSAGIDMAIASNGALFTPSTSKKILPYLSWIRISLNAGSKKTYSKIHGVGEKEFDKVLFNLAEAVRIKKSENLSCAIGIQCLLLPENIRELVQLARTAREIGVDYLTVKPFIKHPLSTHNILTDFDNPTLNRLEKKLQKEATDNFQVVFRSHSIIKLRTESRGYSRCLGLPFFAEIISNGDVYSCGPFLGNPKFCYGNIYHSSFREIWLSENRRKIQNFAAESLDAEKCMKNCRLDEINRYLWELNHPGPHVNFI